MANKGAKELAAAKMKIQPGGTGKMHTFEGVGTQKTGSTSVSKTNTTGKFAKGGGSGKMHKFAGVKPVKAGSTSVK